MTVFLKSKYETFREFEALMKKTKRRLGHQLVSIRSDHGTEFENSDFMEFCATHGISHNFSAPHTPQQNDVVERKNKTLEEMTITMLISSSFLQRYWHYLLHSEQSNASSYSGENSI